MTCAICGLPLSEPEIRLNRIWHFDCNKCQICGEGPLTDELITKCLVECVPVSHTTCLKTKLFKNFRDKVIPVTQAHVDALNNEICSVYLDKGGKVLAINPEQVDCDTLYTLLLRMQEAATNVSFVLGLSREKLLIRNTQTFNTQLEHKRKIEKDLAIQTETERLAAQKRTQMFAAERENPALRHKRKAIEGFMAIGMSEAEAIAAVEKNAATKEGPIQ